MKQTEDVNLKPDVKDRVSGEREKVAGEESHQQDIKPASDYQYDEGNPVSEDMQKSRSEAEEFQRQTERK